LLDRQNPVVISKATVRKRPNASFVKLDDNRKWAKHAGVFTLCWPPERSCKRRRPAVIKRSDLGPSCDEAGETKERVVFDLDNEVLTTVCRPK
jgi:hypothetical protein